MNYLRKFRVNPGEKIRLRDCDPQLAAKDKTKKSTQREIAKLQQRLDQLQFQLYAENKRSLLICLQAPDAGGKDGVVRHVIGSMNPQGCRVVPFEQPTAEELAHDFLWRIERQTPRSGEVVIFNRSHYEDVVVVRVHDLVPKKIWSQRYEQVNDFERRLAARGTHILKFFLNISAEEQLSRFKDRLDDPARHWKISEADYTEREYWDDYQAAYQDADQPLQHRRRALVCHSFRSQMVPQPGHLAHHRRDDGPNRHPGPEAGGEHCRYPQAISSRGRGRKKEEVSGITRFRGRDS